MCCCFFLYLLFKIYVSFLLIFFWIISKVPTNLLSPRQGICCENRTRLIAPDGDVEVPRCRCRFFPNWEGVLRMVGCGSLGGDPKNQRLSKIGFC